MAESAVLIVSNLYKCRYKDNPANLQKPFFHDALPESSRHQEGDYQWYPV